MHVPFCNLNTARLEQPGFINARFILFTMVTYLHADGLISAPLFADYLY
jgi:hypothetical protein